MTKYIKPIYCLPLVLMFVFSCNGPDKTPLPKEKESTPSTFTRQQMLLNVPWADRAVLPEGC